MHTLPTTHTCLASLLLPLVLAACATDEAKDTEAATAGAATSARAELAARAKVTPTFGGSVLWVGDYQAELAVHEDGLVQGLVFGADGQALAHERVSSFGAVLALESGARLALALSWDANAARFRGRAALTSELVMRPVDVKLEVDGTAQAGVLEEYALLPALDVHAEANATADMKAASDAKGLSDVKIEAKLAQRVPSAPLGAKGAGEPRVSVDGHAKAGVKAVTKANARATAKTSAKAQLDVPVPKVSATAKTSAATEPRKSGASVKAKASFGLGQ